MEALFLAEPHTLAAAEAVAIIEATSPGDDWAAEYLRSLDQARAERDAWLAGAFVGEAA